MFADTSCRRGRVGGFRWGKRGETGRYWEGWGGGSYWTPTGVSEDREINGSPPTHTHTKGWINPNDWERGGGSLETVSVWDTFSRAYLGGTDEEEKPGRARLVQKLNLLIWILSSTPKSPGLKTQHSDGFALVIVKDSSSGSH